MAPPGIATEMKVLIVTFRFPPSNFIGAIRVGKLARPAEIRFTDALPKTRSGKIMRRLLRDIASGQETSGDTSTLEDYSILARLRADEE